MPIAAVPDDSGLNAVILRGDTAADEGRAAISHPGGLVEPAGPTGFGRATGTLRPVTRASGAIHVAGASLNQGFFACGDDDVLQELAILAPRAHGGSGGSDNSDGGRTREECEAAGARDEVAPRPVEARKTSDRLGGAAPCSDAREPPLADHLSAFINELISATHHLSQLSDRLAAMSSVDAEASYRDAIRKLLKILNHAADSELDTCSRKSSVRLCVENYINRNLSSRDISPEKIYKELEIPRSSLYKAFSNSGGVAKYIQDRRLDVAKTLIAHPEEHRSLNQIADCLGFESGAHFSKAFRRRFGSSPREVRKISTILTSEARQR